MPPLQLVKSDPNAPRNIPPAVFIGDVEEFIENHSPVEVNQALNELLSKYRWMESRMLKQQTQMKAKIPNLVGALDAIKYLIYRQEEKLGSFNTHFMLCDNIYAQAEIPETDTVILELGAKTMLEYPLKEAHELLTTHLANAHESLKELADSLQYTRKQITTCQVNTARVHNYNVTLRKKSTQS